MARKKKKVIAEYKFKIFTYEWDNTRYIDATLPPVTTTMDCDNIYSWAKDMYEKIRKEWLASVKLAKTYFWKCIIMFIQYKEHVNYESGLSVVKYLFSFIWNVSKREFLNCFFSNPYLLVNNGMSKCVVSIFE